MDEFEQDYSRTSKIGQIIGIIICLVLLIGLSFGLIFIKHEKMTFINDINEVNKQIKEKEDLLEMKDSEIININKQIEENSNTDKLTQELKDNYLTLVKELERKIINEEIDAKIAYLAFVGGPYSKTDDFLNVLDNYDTRATFFTLNNEEEYTSTYQRIINEGHTLAINAQEDDIESIIENKEYIKNTFDYDSELVMLNNQNDIDEDLIEQLNDENLAYVNHNSETGDSDRKVGTNQSILNVLDNANNRKILVVLMHDDYDNTLNALGDIIQGLRKQGYTLLPLFSDSVMANK